MARLLENELQTYEKRRDELLEENEGKFVLVHNDQFLGIYDSEIDAITEGYKKLGSIPFLVKQILRLEIPQNYVSNLLGV